MKNAAVEYNRAVDKPQRMLFLGLIFSVNLMGQDLSINAPNLGINGPRLLPSAATEKTISLKEAIIIALERHNQLLLSRNTLERKKAENYGKISALLPKARLSSSYIRNIPEVEMALPPLSHGSDNKIVLNPKDLLTGKLTVEIPLFNGPDLARLLLSRENVRLFNQKVLEEEANTIFKAARAYYAAVHLKNILLIREQAEIRAKNSLLKLELEQQGGLAMKNAVLLAKAIFMERQAETQAALIDYRARIGELGILMGYHEELRVLEPEQAMFDILNADVEQLTRIAKANRSDLKAEDHALKFAKIEKFGNYMQFLPVFTLQGDANYTSNDKSMVGKNLTYAISVNATISLFDGGSSFAQFKESSLKRQESEIKLRQLSTGIETKIRGHKIKLLQLELKKNALELKTKALMESEAVAENRYQLGVMEFEDFMDHSCRRLNAEIDYRKTQLDVIEEMLALSYETGLLTPQLIR